MTRLDVCCHLNGIKEAIQCCQSIANGCVCGRYQDKLMQAGSSGGKCDPCCRYKNASNMFKIVLRCVCVSCSCRGLRVFPLATPVAIEWQLLAVLPAQHILLLRLRGTSSDNATFFFFTVKPTSNPLETPHLSFVVVYRILMLSSKEDIIIMHKRALILGRENRHVK